ncbi:ABC transporter permease [Candidatus Puniceispirillum sp.]|nr:ABC transporter permease [Candidatus Puniceispirillum sp.]
MVLEWLSENRAIVAAIIILLLASSFLVSIIYGVQQTRLREKDQVFGDPERTVGGWFWSICGVSVLLLIWFYFSWGAARAFFPQAANELCQVGKLHEAISPVTASLAIQSRYSKSKTLLVRNSKQLRELKARLPVDAFLENDKVRVLKVINNTQKLINMMANPDFVGQKTIREIEKVKSRFAAITNELKTPLQSWSPSQKALQQPSWGISEPEIPMLPISAKGALFDLVSSEAKSISNDFLGIRNLSPIAKDLISETKAMIANLKKLSSASDRDPRIVKTRADYMKAVDRIFKRIDDGKIFPASVMTDIQGSVRTMLQQLEKSKGALSIVEILFFPGGDIIKSRTQCTEQGPGRWLPKPTDVVATFLTLANPDVENGGGYKGTTLLWWKWLPISDVVSLLVPDGLVDLLPGDYGTLNKQGNFQPNYKDWVLLFAQGDVYLGALPMLDGHIWDSLFRVLVAMFFGVLLGVPLGIYMGVSRFCKSFFDPLIELYRPVPPLAWAPLILTIFGIQDDGKIFLLFMVAFAIMVISARTGASGTQLSKIRASHSLGASDRQILRYVILPNALPEIMTGIRISIGVCWGTLVAAEMLAGTTGVGFIENVARTVSDYELIWVTILIMGSLGLIFDLMMRWVIARLIPWRGKG